MADISDTAAIPGVIRPVQIVLTQLFQPVRLIILVGMTSRMATLNIRNGISTAADGAIV